MFENHLKFSHHFVEMKSKNSVHSSNCAQIKNPSPCPYSRRLCSLASAQRRERLVQNKAALRLWYEEFKQLKAFSVGRLLTSKYNGKDAAALSRPPSSLRMDSVTCSHLRAVYDMQEACESYSMAEVISCVLKLCVCVCVQTCVHVCGWATAV